jgi:hypothetical protein
MIAFHKDSFSEKLFYFSKNYGNTWLMPLSVPITFYGSTLAISDTAFYLVNHGLVTDSIYYINSGNNNALVLKGTMNHPQKFFYSDTCAYWIFDNTIYQAFYKRNSGVNSIIYITAMDLATSNNVTIATLPIMFNPDYQNTIVNLIKYYRNKCLLFGMLDEFILIENNQLITHNKSISELEFSIYPNPATNQLTVDNGIIKMESIVIQNVLGETVYLKQYSNSLESIDVSGFASGVYFVRMNEKSLKFIKE